jgi:hypothetical protein
MIFLPYRPALSTPLSPANCGIARAVASKVLNVIDPAAGRLRFGGLLEMASGESK